MDNTTNRCFYCRLNVSLFTVLLLPLALFICLPFKLFKLQPIIFWGRFAPSDRCSPMPRFLFPHRLLCIRPFVPAIGLQSLYPGSIFQITYPIYHKSLVICNILNSLYIFDQEKTIESPFSRRRRNKLPWKSDECFINMKIYYRIYCCST